jgi:hypothetical protein
MANDTSFDILSQFSPPGMESYTLKFPTSSTSNVTISNTATTADFGEQEMLNQEVAPGDQFNSQTQRLVNIMSDYYAGTYLPTIKLKQENVETAKEEMGFGKRYTANDFKAQFRNEFGPIPKTSSTEKAFRLLYDMFTKKTQLPGKAGVLDVLFQAGGAYMNREQQEKAEKLKREMLISEMAIKQANEMNKVMLTKESELILKGMGYTEDALQEMLNFNTNTQSKFIQQDIDRQNEIMKSNLTREEKLLQGEIDTQLKYEQMDIDNAKKLYEHSLLMLRNPEKAFPTLMYSDDGGKTVKTVPVQLKPNPIDGAPMYMLGRKVTTDQGTFDVFDQPVPSDWEVRGIYTGDAPGTEAKALSSGFGAAQLSEIGSDYFVMTQAIDEIGEVLAENAKRIQAGQGPIIGTEGFLKGLGQEITFIGKDVLNTMFGSSGNASTLGTNLEELGQQNYQNDLANFDLLNRGESVNAETVPLFDSAMPITYEVEKKGIGGVLGQTETKTVETSFRDMFDQNFYKRLGYDDVYARNKVRENYLVYAIARALKSSGRLNVNDIEAARETLTITDPFTSSAGAAAKLEEIQGILSTAAQNIVRSTMLGDQSITNINPAIREDYEKRFGPLILEGQEPIVNQKSTTLDSGTDQGTIYIDPDVPDFDINVIGGSN